MKFPREYLRSWNAKGIYLFWMKFGIFLIHNNQKDSKVVLATRFHDICFDMESDGWLNWNKCLMHGKFRQKCKSSGNLTNSQASCSWVCGLPLLLNQVASTFKRKDNIHIWSDGLRSLQRCPNVKVQGMDELIEFLKFCYEDLDCDDKKIKK